MGRWMFAKPIMIILILYIYYISMLYALNICSDVYSLFLNKTEGKKENNNNACQMLSKIVHNGGHSIKSPLFLLLWTFSITVIRLLSWVLNFTIMTGALMWSLIHMAKSKLSLGLALSQEQYRTRKELPTWLRIIKTVNPSRRVSHSWQNSLLLASSAVIVP